jgi:hypothetical protein
MSESKKLLIGFGVVGLICICVACLAFFGFRQFGKSVEKAANGDPASLEKMQEKIAGFDVPPGYKSMVMSLVLYDVVSLTPDTARGSTSIILMQYNSLSFASEEQIKQQLQEMAEQQSGQAGASMKLVDSYETVIRGETVAVNVSEGDYQGIAIRQLTTIFKGNNGPTILLIQSAADYWDEQLVTDFIASIR